jgi:adenine-specific DNA-methyltransferase
VLRSATDAAGADRLPELLAAPRQRALSADEAQLLADALRKDEPWLEWSGKREKPWFEVEPVALHMHERVSTQAILRVLAREDVERDLFADPQQECAKTVQFYQHDVDWTNRMILGDSLQVMASLAWREDLAGKVQMIYIDPPYGISFKSNFQPQLGQRDVKDREQDLTREPEKVKAYRDTWTLGRVRCVDEVFEPQNFIANISLVTTTGQTTDFLPATTDYLLWYGKNRERTKFRSLWSAKDFSVSVDSSFSRFETKDEIHDDPARQSEKHTHLVILNNLTSCYGSSTTTEKIAVDGRDFTPKTGGWKTNPEGMRRLMVGRPTLSKSVDPLIQVIFQ